MLRRDFINSKYMAVSLMITMFFISSCNTTPQKTTLPIPSPIEATSYKTPVRVSVPKSESNVDFDAFLRGMYGDRYLVVKDSLERAGTLSTLGLDLSQPQSSNNNIFQNIIQVQRMTRSSEEPLSDILSRFNNVLNSSYSSSESDDYDDLESRIAELEEKIEELESELDEYR